MFLRYLLVAVWNTFFGVAVYGLLYLWLGKHFHYLLLLIPSNVLAISNAFICYKFFVFKTKGNVLREYFRCYIIYGSVMLASAALVFVLVEWIGLAPPISNFVAVAVTTIFSYLAHKNFSFKADLH
jgi:putative flippase GtrA